VYVTFTFFFWFFYYTIMAGTLGAVYLPRKEEIRHGLWQQFAYYFLHFFRGRPDPHQGTCEKRFNPLEKTLYLVIMLGLFPVQMVTGVALKSLYPPWKIIDLFGSIKFLMGLHFLNGCLLLALILVHVYLTTLNGSAWPKVRSLLRNRNINKQS
jgi:thiosulfate reductase cytochrome b subunit